MKKNDLKVIGSYTAKGGFENENGMVVKFNNWKTDKEAQIWLVIMGYVIEEIEDVKAVKLSNRYKTDVQVQITIYLKKAISAENLSINLVSNPTGFNQIDKRWIKKYVEMWNIPEDVVKILKLFTGEIPPKNIENLRDARRMFFDEMKDDQKEKLVSFFSKNKFLIISDILKGRGKFRPHAGGRKFKTQAQHCLSLFRPHAGGRKEYFFESINFTTCFIAYFSI